MNLITDMCSPLLGVLSRIVQPCQCIALLFGPGHFRGVIPPAIQAVPGSPKRSQCEWSNTLWDWIRTELWARLYLLFSGSSGFLVNAGGTCVFWLCHRCLNGLQSAIAQDGYHGSKMVLRLSQDGVKLSQDGPKMSPWRAKMNWDAPKMVPRWCKRVVAWPAHSPRQTRMPHSPCTANGL